MTTSPIEEVVRDIESIDENAHLEEGDALSRIIETVIAADYEEWGLARFRTIRRDGDDIVESGFVLDRAMGKRNSLGSRIYRGKNQTVYDPKDSKKILHILQASREYPKFDKFLKERGR